MIHDQCIVLMLILLPEAVLNSLVSEEVDKQFLHAFTSEFSGPVLWVCVSYHFMVDMWAMPTYLSASALGKWSSRHNNGWDFAAPRHFYFIIIALTIDWGISCKAEILWTDLYERWHPQKVALKSQFFSMTHSIVNVFLWKLHGCMLDFMYPFTKGVAETPELNH